MAYIRKIKGSLVRQDSSVYVGEDTYLFYDIDTGCIRRSNGTPGGEDIGACFGGGAGGGVKEYPSVTAFPVTGATDVIYIAADENKPYYWNGTIYVPLDGHDQVSVTVPNNSTIAVYTIAGPTTNLTLKFIISVSNPTTGELNSSEVLGSFKISDTSLKHTHYAKIGDRIKFQVDLIFNGTDVELTIFNKETTNLLVGVSRIPAISV